VVFVFVVRLLSVVTKKFVFLSWRIVCVLGFVLVSACVLSCV
jgi:hypothetical protein